MVGIRADGKRRLCRVAAVRHLVAVLVALTSRIADRAEFTTTDSMTPFLHIRNAHLESCGEPPKINGGDGQVYTDYFENEFGEQWVFTYDRHTKVAQLRGGDVGCHSASKPISPFRNSGRR